MRDILVERVITINGLTILNEHPTLNLYFEQRIIGGSGAFVGIANNYQDYSNTILRKLIKELTNDPVSGLSDHEAGTRLAGLGALEGVGVR